MFYDCGHKGCIDMSEKNEFESAKKVVEAIDGFYATSLFLHPTYASQIGAEEANPVLHEKKDIG